MGKGLMLEELEVPAQVPLPGFDDGYLSSQSCGLACIHQKLATKNYPWCHSKDGNDGMGYTSKQSIGPIRFPQKKPKAEEYSLVLGRGSCRLSEWKLLAFIKEEMPGADSVRVAPLEDKGKAMNVTYLDFSLGLDTISHSNFLERLAVHGLEGYSVHWCHRDLDERIKFTLTLSQLADNTKFGGSVHLLECRKVLYRHLDKLAQGQWYEVQEGQVLILGHNNLVQCHRLWAEWLESCPAEKDYWVLVDGS
ncbi:hypothetical protein WISP_45842 [Willisornis vidua]|uniref:Uncharacterized protein n=1 Tax=Willisornis vidua TaxID=1566151 RepID=A0ABQ9DJU9_9PASS|nr:hypothetical protein WISP_45842 [Willisornis vidua]